MSQMGFWKGWRLWFLIDLGLHLKCGFDLCCLVVDVLPPVCITVSSWQ
jgi:hypothetical protein